MMWGVYNMLLPKYSVHKNKKCGAKILNTTIPLNRSTGIYRNAPRFSVWFMRRNNCYLCHMKKLIDKVQHAWNSLLYKLMFKNYK